MALTWRGKSGSIATGGPGRWRAWSRALPPCYNGSMVRDMTSELLSLDSTLRLLILLARLELSVPQQQEAMALCARIDDWAEVTRQAKQQFVLPLVYRHLRHLSPPSLSSQDAAQMRSQCLKILQHNLQVVAEQQRLVRELLAACRTFRPSMR